MEELRQNIYDTVKEWQIKIGYQPGSMNLYYPKDSLLKMLHLSEQTDDKQLYAALADFSEYAVDTLGELKVSHVGERYCLVISKEGCDYINKEVPASDFLKEFIATITTKNCDLQAIKTCFSRYEVTYIYEEREQEGLGHVFYFQDKNIDAYVYCVEIDAFGATYHRFTPKDYEQMLNS